MWNYTVCSGRVAICSKGCGWYEHRLLGRLKPCLVGLQYLRGTSSDGSRTHSGGYYGGGSYSGGSGYSGGHK